MTSRHTKEEFEGYGISVVEAALCGKLSVVSKNSGLLEAIVDQKTGMAVEEGNVEKLAEAVCDLLQDQTLRDRLSENAYERAMSEQLWEHAVEKYASLCRKIIDGVKADT